MSITQEQADEIKATLMKAVKQCADLIHHTIDEYSAVGDLINSIDSLIEKQPLHYDGEPFNDEYEFTGKYRFPASNDDAFVDIYDVANVNTYGIMENINEGKRWILRKRKPEPEPSFKVGDWVTYLAHLSPLSTRPDPERPPQFSTWTPENQKQYIETR